MLKETRRCELCSDAAALYCPSDSAYLCLHCDSAVHSANFLVARHDRSTLCSWCGDFDGNQFSGVGIRRCGRSPCRSCGQSAAECDDVDDESTLSSDCVSTTESSTACRPVKPKGNGSVGEREDCCGEVSSEMRRRERTDQRRTWRSKVDVKVEGILVNWCKRLGLGRNHEDVVVATSAQILGVSLEKLTYVPVRVALAASFWLGVRFCGEKSVSTCQNLKRVERITGVPANVILAMEAKLGRLMKTRQGTARDYDCEEGWAEC